MSVIPIVTDGPNRSIVTRAAEYRREGPAVLITDFDPEQRPSSSITEKGNSSAPDCNISYDLRIGERYRDHRDAEPTTTKNNDIVLMPGNTVIIETEETIHVPETLFGAISPKVGLLQQGISNTFSKVDPGYDGKLLITVFNLGKRPVRLKRRQRFCSIFFMRVDHGVLAYDKGAKQILGMGERSASERIRDWIEMKQSYLTALLILTTLLLVSTQLALAIYFVRV